MQHPSDALAKLGTANRGLVSRAQLLGAGVTAEQIRWRLRTGALMLEYPGVYRVGHRAPNVETSCLAAVWACGDEAVLCGLAAAHLYALVRGLAPLPEVATRTRRKVPGVRTRRLRLEPAHVTTWRGIPITTVPRTLVDIATLPLDALTRACHEAEVIYRVTPQAVEAILSTQPGAARLRAVLHGDVHVTLSGLEKRFLALLRAAGLALPITNRPAGSKHVDCRWPALRLTVELDSYRYHHSRHAWEKDRAREREARARGDDFRRFTYGDVFESPAAMMAELRSILPRAASTRGPGRALR